MPRKSTRNQQPSTSNGNTERRSQLSSDEDSSDSFEAPRAIRGTRQNAKSAKERPKPRQMRSSDSEPEANTSTFLSQLTQPKPIDKKAQVNDMVKLLLNYSATKLVIKRTGSAETVERSKELLEEIYGLEVSEVGTGSSKGWIVHSTLPGVTALQLEPENRNEITLLFIILAYIFMKGGDVQEAHLIQFLENIHISVDETHHLFGDVGKLIREKFSRQQYLKRTKVEIEGVNEPQLHVTWGPRAEKEFDKKEILMKVADIMNKSPEMFVNQYHEVMQEHQADNAEDILMID